MYIHLPFPPPPISGRVTHARKIEFGTPRAQVLTKKFSNRERENRDVSQIFDSRISSVSSNLSISVCNISDSKHNLALHMLTEMKQCDTLEKIHGLCFTLLYYTSHRITQRQVLITIITCFTRDTERDCQ